MTSAISPSTVSVIDALLRILTFNCMHDFYLFQLLEAQTQIELLEEERMRLINDLAEQKVTSFSKTFHSKCSHLDCSLRR